MAVAPANYQFGAGVLWGIPNTSNPSPVAFGTMQNCSVEFGFDHKELYGQNQMPVAVARGKGKVSGKCSFARVNGLVINNLFFGLTQSAGQLSTAWLEAGTVPGSSAYTVTVSNAAHYLTDLGAIKASTGAILTRVASAPAAGQYSVDTSTGIYTFPSTLAGLQVLISYTYAPVSGGFISTITNQQMGVAPTFQINFFNSFGANQMSLQLNECVATKLGMATKLDDFTIPDFEFSAFSDAAGNIGIWGLPE